jgi:hypothetical protein
MKSVDVFPAVVRVAPPDSLEDITDLTVYGDAPAGSRFLDRCRVVILNEVILIANDTPSGPQLIFREKLVETHHIEKMSHVKTISGKILAFRKDDNCGCGSRLRSWNPYGNVMMSNQDPT